MKHTPEPWHVDIGDDAVYVVDSDENVAIARVTNYKLQDVAEINARRIVACVNALAGMPDSALVGANIRNQLDRQHDALREAESDNATLRAALQTHGAEAAKLMQHRDELLAALDGVINATGVQEYVDALHNARAAIANATDHIANPGKMVG